MWECKYGKEPLDLRLCALRLMRKWWLLLLMGMLGAFLFGGIYFLTHVVYAPAREYIAEAEFYVEYKDVITEEQQYTFYNKETWETLIHTDLFLRTIMEEVEGVDEAFLKEALFATLMTDVRIVHARVSTNKPELTMEIVKALETAFIHFGQQQKEVEEIRIISTPTTAEYTLADNRTWRGAVLGAVFFLCTTLFVMYLYVIVDTSIWLPLEFQRLYSIKMEIAQDKQGANDQSVWLEEVEGGYSLYVKSGDHNRQIIETFIRNSQLTGERIVKAVLVNPDQKLISAYMEPRQVGSFLKTAAKGENG